MTRTAHPNHISGRLGARGGPRGRGAAALAARGHPAAGADPAARGGLPHGGLQAPRGGFGCEKMVWGFIAWSYSGCVYALLEMTVAGVAGGPRLAGAGYQRGRRRRRRAGAAAPAVGAPAQAQRHHFHARLPTGAVARAGAAGAGVGTVGAGGGPVARGAAGRRLRRARGGVGGRDTVRGLSYIVSFLHHI